MWSLEAATHAPVDIGIQTVLEAPVGLRLGGGYGVVPAVYLDFVTDAAGAQSGTSIFDSGSALRLFAGIRPSQRIGLYFDGGYVRATLDGSLRESALPASYSVTSRLDLWFIEMGYQTVLSERFVLGAGVGVVGLMNATTEASPNGDVGKNSQALTDEATAEVDRQLEDFGLLPTVSIRLGFDLL